jgi:hypothetical protein
MLLFGIFIVSFAECNHIMHVDVTPYGRLPELIGHCISILRGAMGDFSMIDPYQGFDLIESDESDGDHDADDDKITYVHSFQIYIFTFVLWAIGIFFLFMIFMNFIIAVIGDSYNAVIEFKEAHDY